MKIYTYIYLLKIIVDIVGPDLNANVNKANCL